MTQATFRYPCSMSLEELAAQDRDSLGYDTLMGIFAAYRAGELDRHSLTEAISDWQSTRAKEALAL